MKYWVILTLNLVFRQEQECVGNFGVRYYRSGDVIIWVFEGVILYMVSWLLTIVIRQYSRLACAIENYIRELNIYQSIQGSVDAAPLVVTWSVDMGGYAGCLIGDGPAAF